MSSTPVLVYICILLPFQEIVSTLDAGRKKLQEAQQKGDVVMPETSTQGQELIHEELLMLTSDFEGFESDVNDLKHTLCEFQNYIQI